MHLVQILLPMFDNSGARFSGAHYERVAGELTERFGGLTAYTRAPAEGRWRESGAGTSRDEILVHEVMAETLDADWWRRYRAQLEERFEQEHIVVRAHLIEVL